MTATPRPSSSAFRYAAFISYKRDVDLRTASALQAGLRRIAKPWYRRAALRICRDKTDLVLNPALWPALKERLDASEHLILLASPEAAASPWIEREIADWLATRAIDNVLIVLTAGDIVWDPVAGDFEPSRTTALPRALYGRYRDEPTYLDLRFARSTAALSLKHPSFRDAVAELAARLLRREKSDVLGDDLREQRRLLRLAWSAAAALLLLAAATTVAAVFALRQRDAATRERTLAVARQLVAQSQLIGRDTPELTDRSALLALEAGRRATSLESDRALRAAASLLPALRATLPHGHAVNRVVFSPDGRRLATVLGLQTAVVWDVVTRAELARFTHDRTITALIFSPDSQWAVTAAHDGTAAVWVAETGALVTRVRHDSVEVESMTLTRTSATPSRRTAEPGTVEAVAVSADGRSLATSGQDRTARVWALPAGREVFRARHDDSVTAVAFSPESARLATASADATTRLWDIASGRELHRFAHDDRVTSVAFANDGRRVVSAGYDGTARIWDLDGGHSAIVLRHDAAVSDVVFSDDGARVGTASRDGTARVWEAASGRELFRATHDTSVSRVQFGPSALHLATCAGIGRLWELDRKVEVARFLHEQPVRDIAISPDGGLVATAGADGVARIWAAGGGNEVLRLTHRRRGRPEEVVGVMFSADERVIVTTGDFTAGARAWDAANGKELMSTAGRGSVGVGAAPGPGDTLIWTERDRVRISDARTSRLIAEMNTADVDFAELMKSGRVAMSRAVFSPDGQRMAKIVNGSGYVWDIESNRTVTRLTLSPPIEVLTFASNRLLGVSRGLEREPGAMVEIWDLETRQVVTRMSHPDPLHLMAISADGRLVATPGTRRVQTIFGDELARPGATLRILASASATAVTNRAFEAPIAAAAFDPTGRHVAVATDAGVISILDAAAGEEIVRLSHDRPAAVGFSPSGRYLVTAGGDGTARVWLWRGADLAADACTRLTRNLTWAEWRDFLPSDEPYDKTCAGLPVHPSVVEAARTQARKGDLAAASAIFARAVEIEPSMGLVPDDEAKRWKAVADGEQLVKYAETLAARGEVKEAVAALARAAALLPDLDRSATPWNQVCWFGSLTGGAALVLDACAKAVAISPDNASIRDSRGLARALTGDVNGAIEDFKAFVASRPDLPEADDRRRWIDALAVGQNPFTAEVLKQLLARSR